MVYLFEFEKIAHSEIIYKINHLNIAIYFILLVKYSRLIAILFEEFKDTSLIKFMDRFNSEEKCKN